MPLEFDGVNSKVSADKIQGQTGTTVTIESGHSLSGSGASLTNLPAANLTGTVADARISTLTASKLSGTIDGARLPDPLPAISGASLTNLPSHSGNVAFPATQVASADANTLDDYEEGTWTPILKDSSSNAATLGTADGTYTKIGRMVYWRLYIAVSAYGSMTEDGVSRIYGLPFSPSGGLNYNSCSFSGGSGLAITAGNAVTGFVSVSPYIEMQLWSATTGTSNLSRNEWSSDGSMFVAGTYHV